MSPDPDSLPLRERVRDAEKLVRELIDHLENGYLARVRELQRITSTDAPPTGDMTVRASVGKVLEADKFTDDLWKRTRGYLQSIKGDLERMAAEGE